MDEPRGTVTLNPPSPGDVLQSEFVARRGVTQDQLAQALGVSRLTVNQILNNKRNVTAEMAVRLSYVLGTSEYFWLDLQREVDLHKARARLSPSLGQLSVLTPSSGPPLASREALFGANDSEHDDDARSRSDLR